LIVFAASILWASVLSTCALDGRSDEARTLATFEKLDDFPFYMMTYYGDYNLEKAPTASALPGGPTLPIAGADWACTVYSASAQEADFLLGRNFDWHSHPALLLFADPPDGNASVSMVDLHYLGFRRGEEPSQDVLQNLLEAPHWPFDGMNEYGLAVGMMAVPHAEPPRDPEKETIGSLEAIRLMLDYARDTEEAITLLKKYNIDFMGGPPLHYLIADAEGKSVVLEFIGGKLLVLRSETPWQVSTNFLLAEGQPEGAHAPCWRYSTAYRRLEGAKGALTEDGAMSLLESVSQSHNTIWSVVYNRTSGDIAVAVSQNYDQVYEFHLPIQVDLRSDPLPP
jgi:hypothetical protein